MQKTLRVIMMFTFFGSFLFGCATTERNANDPAGAFAIAEEFDKSERYEEAIRRYSEIKNKFPYSNYATQAELAIADCLFKQESYPEAQVAYQSFKELHPTAPESDYVQFRIGLSYFNQLPSTIDRDLALADEAIVNLNIVLKKYPKSQYVAEAKEKRSAAIKMLAEKEDYIGDFYFKRKIYDSALVRYEGLYTNYRGLGFDAKALSRAAISAYRVGDLAKVKKYRETLAREFSGSQELQDLEREINR
jgi:outer membrane protein assembly factor BamD